MAADAQAAPQAIRRAQREARRPSSPRPRWKKSWPSTAGSRTRSRRRAAWDLDKTLEIAMDALRCPPPTPTSRRSPAAKSAASRCAASCSKNPTCFCSTSRPITSTPNPSPGSSDISQNIPGTVVAVTHDRYFLDNVAGWILELDRGPGYPWEGNYSSWLEQKEAAGARRETGIGQAATTAARAGVGRDGAARAPRKEQGAA